jgi:hypothetical protein
MRRLFAIVALFVGFLAIEAAFDPAHSHELTAAHSNGDANDHPHSHDPDDHSHQPGDDPVHQLVFHGSAAVFALIEAEAPLCAVYRPAPVQSSVAILRGITLPPADRPPTR